MKRGWLLVGFCLASLAAVLHYWAADSRAQQAIAVQWIWFDEGNPAEAAPAETRYFRKVFQIDRPVEKVVDEGTLDITVDNAFKVWVNGALVGSGDKWERVYRFDVTKLLVNGRNVIAVEAKNTDGPAGLLARLAFVPNGQDRRAVVSDGSWKSSKTAAEGWQKLDFKEAGWSAVKVIGPYGKAGPWKNQIWDAGGGDDRFTVPPGFKVELAVKRPADDSNFSLVNLTFDAKGRLLLSRENGPVFLCTNPDKNGVFQTVKPYCEQVKNCHGMCWVKDALLLVGNGPDGTGLYRVRDTDGDDKTDEVKLLHKFPAVAVPGYGVQGGMSEHGPHAIIHGPDNWLYLVVGNHAWAKPDQLAANSPLTRWPQGQMGPDQGKPGTTEDVLLPRLNDGRGHAANLLAPGGTIWRMDHEGKNMSLVAAGFRNHFDAAFSPTGELFTFDSDMEWDEALPWYRGIRICHCPPGADFVWRTGAANTPDYYIDSLPPTLDVGRGSPVGVEFYDHTAFPAKYRGALFLADWSMGLIYAAHLERNGASYKTKLEKFCQGAPMNVTDIAVGPDGALYFTMGGRGSQGDVYRIAYDDAGRNSPFPRDVQPLSAWGRAAIEAAINRDRDTLISEFLRAARGEEEVRPSQVGRRIRALNVLQNHGAPPDANLFAALMKDKAPEVRAHAVWLGGVNWHKENREDLIDSLKDGDALVRRRACEALIRAGFEPPVDAIWPVLADKDRFVRTASRLVVQRIDPKKWVERIWKEQNDPIAWEGIIALCKNNQATPYTEQIFSRLRGRTIVKKEVQPLLDYLRTVQMALIHTTSRPIWVRAIAAECDQLFPHADWRVNRELAILLTYFAREKQLDSPIHAKLLSSLLASKDDRQQQIHYFYCLRLLKDGWTDQQKKELVAWYESTKGWIGGHSFTPFLENIFRDCLNAYTAADRKNLLANGDQTPLARLVLVQKLQTEPQPELLPELANLSDRLAKKPVGYRGEELRNSALAALIKTAQSKPTAASYPYLLRGLESSNPLVVFAVVDALKKVPTAPKADDPKPYRAVLLASIRLNDRNRWKAVELLRHWSNNKQFGAEEGDWKGELTAWSKWFAQTFPKEPPLPNIGAEKTVELKYKYADLLALVEDPVKGKGDAVRGRKAFEKGLCIKCHKYGKEGEGLGPDLTTVSKRFKRADILESMYYPSKVISDQYRSSTIVTKNGQQITGLAAPQGDTVTVLLNDGTKVTLKKNEIDQQFASLVSVMPENLLDTLTLQEIVDLFAFMESEPAKP